MAGLVAGDAGIAARLADGADLADIPAGSAEVPPTLERECCAAKEQTPGVRIGMTSAATFLAKKAAEAIDYCADASEIGTNDILID